MRKLLASILETTDKHLRDTDFKTIGGYRSAVEACILDQIEYTEREGITHIFDAGDICDKGYRSIAASESHRNLMERWVRAVNGNYYSTIGNHLFHEIDNNPELYWIQPHPTIKPKDPEYKPPDEPLIRIVDSLLIGTFQTSFFHYSRDSKLYVNRREPGATHHHAIFHDDTMIPSNIQRDYHLHRNISSEYLRTIFANIDSCTVGHIHKPYGLIMMNVEGRQIPMDIPGSCCITSITQMELHNTVKLPRYDIYDDGSFEKSYVEFSLHLDKLKFYNKQENSVPKEFLEVSSGSQSSVALEAIANSTSTYLSPERYLIDMGLNRNQLDIFALAKNKDLDVKRAVELTYRPIIN